MMRRGKGMSTHDPLSVLEDLKQQAQRKASLRMFYSAADFLREYRGPYAQETAVEREKLAAEYHNMGKAAEEARWGSGGVMPSVAPPSRPSTPAPPKPVTPPKPRPAVSKPATTPSAKPRTAKVPEYQIEGDKIIFPCRWCKEPVTVPVANAGKYLPCPKCDMLLSVPKLS
jgi:hypothetical protein